MLPERTSYAKPRAPYLGVDVVVGKRLAGLKSRTMTLSKRVLSLRARSAKLLHLRCFAKPRLHRGCEHVDVVRRPCHGRVSWAAQETQSWGCSFSATLG